MKKSNTSTLPFILVSDEAIAERLENLGFVCVNKSKEMFTFINDGKLTFSDDIDVHKIAFSNKLYF